MNGLYDLSLAKPFSVDWAQVLLFITFSLHLLLVLLMLGTAFLALSSFITAWSGASGWQWHKRVLKTFLAHKSLAVVLGVGPLLLIQVNYTVPFFNATSIFAPYWLLILVLMIIAFISFDTLGHEITTYRLRHLFLGVAAFTTLLIIPSIFVLVLTTAENPGAWPAIVKNGFRLDSHLTAHWLFRYMHIIGAALVFGSAFHYFFTFKKEKEQRKPFLRWMLLGMLFQFIDGPMLAMSVPGGIGVSPGTALFIGVSAGALLIWLINSGIGYESVFTPKKVIPVLLVLLYAMLIVRQILQNESFIPLMKEATQNRISYEKRLAAYEQQALAGYKTRLERVYDNGEAIYAGSCAFCHGRTGDGRGQEAVTLSIPPADISAIRATHEYLYKSLLAGVPGTSMPYFSIFDRDKLESLIAYLDKRFGVLGMPAPLPVGISEAAWKKAQESYASLCASCHGPDGKGAAFPQNLTPRPPDFTVYSVSPERAFDVITNGYPGTAMPGFKQLPAEVRWGLVKVIYEKRIG